MDLKKWFNDNKVVILGAAASAGVVLQQYMGTPSPDYKIIALALVAGIGSYFAKNLRGQWASILGIVGNMAVILVGQMQDHTPISWTQVLLQAITGFLAVVAPPAKSISYERSEPIKEAKSEAAIVDDIKDLKPPPPVGK